MLDFQPTSSILGASKSRRAVPHHQQNGELPLIQKSYRAHLMICLLLVLIAIPGCSAAQPTVTETVVLLVTATLPPRDNFEEVNLAAQTGDPDSLLSHYRPLIHARSSHEALRLGEWQDVQVKDNRIYAFLRRTDEGTLLVLINLSGDSINDYGLDLAVGPLDEGGAREVLSDASVSPPELNADGGFYAYRPLEELSAYSTFVVQLE
jgi:hypothetical protein